MNKKKLFSGISSAVLILGSLSPMQAFAQTEGETPFQETQTVTEVTTKENKFRRCPTATWKIENGTLIISGNLKSEFKIPGEWDWFNDYRNDIKRVEFADGFEFSGSIAGMFGDMQNLENINFDNFPVTSVTNMYATFWNCKSLSSIDLSKFKTENVKNMWSLFDGCERLTTLDVSTFDTSQVTDMWAMFNKCKQLKSLDLSNFDTSKVTRMQSLFAGCSNLEKVDLSSFDTSKVTTMEAMFRGCEKLASINLNSFDTSNVTTMQSMFNQCGSLKEINLSSFNTVNVADMGCMFIYCKNLESLDLSNFNTPNLTDTNQMFANCNNLSNLDLGSNRYPSDGMDVADVTDMHDMFRQCTNLRELDLTKWTFAEKVNRTGMFGGSGLNAVWLTQNSSEIYPALSELSATWHVQQTGPYPTDQIVEKTQEYADKGVKQVIVERFLDYKLTYNSLYEAVEMPAETKVASDTGNCILTVTAQLPKRSGYTFLGWADTSDAAQAKYQAGDKVTLNLASDGLHKDLYAVWRRNSNSSSGSSSSSNRVNLSSVHEMHRMYNPNSGEHFYTKETAERDHLVSVGWNYEGTAWYSPKSSSNPVYRLYNPNAGDHHYTLDAKEKDELVKLGWRYEGIGWYSASKSNGQAIHRQYNPNAVAGAHNFTTDENERDFLINNGWSHEGVAWYGVHPKNIKK